MRHGRFGIEHSFVEIDVDDIGSIRDLLPRNCNGGVEIPGQDRFRKPRRTSDISAFTNDDESKLRCDVEWFEAGESEGNYVLLVVARGFFSHGIALFYTRCLRHQPRWKLASRPGKCRDVCR